MAKKKKGCGCLPLMTVAFLALVCLGVLGSLLPEPTQRERSGDVSDKAIATGASTPSSARLEGVWICEAEIGAGKPLSPPYHKTWNFDGDRVTINGGRKLWVKTDPSTVPMRLDVYNKVGDRTINLYACIYKVVDSKLVICFEAGDKAPTTFEAGPRDTSIMLTFNRGL